MVDKYINFVLWIFTKKSNVHKNNGETTEIAMFIISIQCKELQCWITRAKISIRNLGNHVKLFESFGFEPEPFDKSTALSCTTLNILSHFGKTLSIQFIQGSFS